MQFFSAEFSPWERAFILVCYAGWIGHSQDTKDFKTLSCFIVYCGPGSYAGCRIYCILMCSRPLFSLHRYLQQCGIAQIEKRAFKDLQSLNGLHLSHNNILELFPNAFQDLLMKDL